MQSTPLTLYSDGIALAADLWLPKAASADAPAPGVLLCHGWSGLKDSLNAGLAPRLVGAGLACLTFDYRGWGESEGRIVPNRPLTAPLTAGHQSLEVRVVREHVDPFEQVNDAHAALDCLAGSTAVDGDRLGVWGTSFGAGHALTLAGNDSRVRALVVQAGLLRPNMPVTAIGYCLERARQKAAGEIDSVTDGLDSIPGLPGTGDLANMARYWPIRLADRVNAPTRVIDTELEDVFDRSLNGDVLYALLKDRLACDHRLLPCKHFAIYEAYAEEAGALARDWFLEHL